MEKLPVKNAVKPSEWRELNVGMELLNRVRNGRCPYCNSRSAEFEIMLADPLGDTIQGDIYEYECGECLCQFEVEYQPVSVTITQTPTSKIR